MNNFKKKHIVKITFCNDCFKKIFFAKLNEEMSSTAKMPKNF